MSYTCVRSCVELNGELRHTNQGTRDSPSVNELGTAIEHEDGAGGQGTRSNAEVVDLAMDDDRPTETTAHPTRVVIDLTNEDSSGNYIDLTGRDS